MYRSHCKIPPLLSGVWAWIVEDGARPELIKTYCWPVTLAAGIPTIIKVPVWGCTTKYYLTKQDMQKHVVLHKPYKT
jgi:hypothetical protein